MRHRIRFSRFAHAGLALALMAGSVGAVDWTGATGSFNQGSNWQGGQVPSLDDEAVINNGGTAQITGSDEEIARLSIGINGGSGNYVQTGGTFASKGAFIGETATGTAKISAGDFIIGGDSIHVGLESGATGTMTIDGPTALVTSGDDFQLGRGGSGTLNFSAGQLRAGYTVVGKFGSGTWNQSGGFFDQDFGDLEIGDGGRDDQQGEAGPRIGTINLSGGFMQVADHFAIGNRQGTGVVNVSGGVILATNKGDSNLYIGRGMDSSPGVGGPTTLRVVGDDAQILINGNLSINELEVSSKSTLVAEITGATHTPILVGGDANIGNGHLQVVLNGYTPKANDSWALIQTGVEINTLTPAIDNQIAAAGYELPSHADPTLLGSVIGKFLSVDSSSAVLPAGLSWEVAYSTDEVLLRVIGAAGVLGDFNNNGQLDAADINSLSAQVRAGSNNASFDVNNDQLVNDTDREVWVNQLKKTYFGDANLDGEFNTTDFVSVFQAGQYEDTVSGNSVWETGDWNGDAEFNTGDFITAFQAGGFEQGPRAAVSAVPEPSTGLLCSLGALLLVRRRK